MESQRIVALYGSPRRRGNTATLLKQAVAGAREAGAQVEEIVLRDLKMSACLEIYSCKKDGECRIRDDFQPVREKVLSCAGLMGKAYERSRGRPMTWPTGRGRRSCPMMR